MIRRIPRTIFKLIFGGLLSPRGWLSRGLFLLVAFGVLHLLGWRDDTRIISGTLGPKGAEAIVIRGVAYALSYFAAVIIAPILILGAGLLALGQRLACISRPAKQ